MLGQAFAHCRKFPTAASRRSLGRVSVPVWPSALSGRLCIVALVGRYPANQLMHHKPIPSLSFAGYFNICSMQCICLCSLSCRFQQLSPSWGQVAYVLLTRSPRTPPKGCAFDLHVLGTPPAFILSQDQTLHCPISRHYQVIFSSLFTDFSVQLNSFFF